MLPVMISIAVATGDLLVQRLVDDGYENVAIATQGDCTTLWFEDRRSLDANEGLGRVARRVAGSPLRGSVELVALRERIPVLGVRVPVDPLRAFESGAISTPVFESRMSFDEAPPPLPDGYRNSSTFRPELALTPGYLFSDHLQVSLNENLRAQLGTGWDAEGRTLLQVYPGPGLSPGYLLLGGHRPLLPGVDAAWSLGRWSDQNAGGEVAFHGLLGDGAWQWHLQGGLVTQTIPSAVASLAYRFPWLDAYTRFGGGFYPAGDRALFVALGRLFPRSLVEAGYYRSDFGNQLRATLTTYLGPDRRPDPRPFRLEAPGWFSMDYRASAAAGATELWPEPEAGVAWQRLTPDYVRRHLEAWR